MSDRQQQWWCRSVPSVRLRTCYGPWSLLHISLPSPAALLLFLPVLAGLSWLLLWSHLQFAVQTIPWEALKVQQYLSWGKKHTCNYSPTQVKKQYLYLEIRPWSIRLFSVLQPVILRWLIIHIKYKKPDWINICDKQRKKQTPIVLLGCH